MSKAKKAGNSNSVFHRFCRHKLAVAGAVFIVLLCLCAVFAPVIAPCDPNEITPDFACPPSLQHLLGTDQLGRDVLSRIIFASRISLSVGIGSVIVTAVIGIILGLVSGYFGKAVDMVIMRITDVFMSFPVIILLMALAAIAGSGVINMILIIGLVTWPPICRLVRGSVLSLRQMDYVRSAVSSGISTPRILAMHILPNTLDAILVNATFGVASSIMLESSLSFLSLGIAPPTASWGNMLMEAQSLSVLKDMPWLWIPPGLIILLTVLSFNFVGDGLRDALDPKHIR